MVTHNPTRRGMIGMAAAASGIALIAPVSAKTVNAWNAADWIARWHRLGCGLEVGGNALHLKGRLNGDRAAIGAMMAEVAPAERQTAVIEILTRRDASWSPDEDPALTAVYRIEQVDREFISEDDDPAGSAAWLARWEAEARKLNWTPARTAKGLAAKLRQGCSMHSELGDEIIRRSLAQLERVTWR